MAYTEVNGSPARVPMGSPARELDGEPASPSQLQWQIMSATKLYDGYAPYWLGSHWGETDPEAQYWSPPVSWRQNYRTRYATQDIDLTYSLGGTGSTSYNCDAVHSGGGNCPVQTGMPAGIEVHADDTYVQTGLADITYPNLSRAINGERDFINHTDGATIVDPFDGYTRSFMPSRGWTSASLDVNDVHDDPVFPDGWTTVSWSLSSPVSHSTTLAVASTRINARSFPTFSAFEVTPERFDEWWGESGAPDPDDFTGDPVSVSQYDVWSLYNSPPWFGAQTGDVYMITDPCFLWSGWVFETGEEWHDLGGNGGFSTYAISGQGLGVHFFFAQRCRYKAGQSGLDYFIAEATVSRLMWSWGSFQIGQQWDGTKWIRTEDITDVVIKTTGTTTSGSIVEIPYPDGTGYDDFITTHLPVSDVDTLSCGKIRFAIIGETPAQWSARTGIDYT